MTQVNQPVNVSTPADEKEPLYDCAWSSCKENHKIQISYPNGGYYTKRGYRQKWIDEGMQPWDPKTYGQGKKRLRKNGGDYKTMTYEYSTEAHHLIPTTLLKETTTLKDNLVKIGYDCDAKENGMMLPEFHMDMPLHRLQRHKGQHPKGYMGPIRDELRRIEIAADGICSVDIEGTIVSQKRVALAMNALSNRARMKILAIQGAVDNGANFWPVRTNALQEYRHALKEYARRENLHITKNQANTSQGT